MKLRVSAISQITYANTQVQKKLISLIVFC
jgi:hypothetical protein